jgi:hypothetical protein
LTQATYPTAGTAEIGAKKTNSGPRAICAYVKYQPQQGVTEAAMASAGTEGVIGKQVSTAVKYAIRVAD